MYYKSRIQDKPEPQIPFFVFKKRGYFASDDPSSDKKLLLYVLIPKCMIKNSYAFFVIVDGMERIEGK